MTVPTMNKLLMHRTAKPVLFALSLLPFLGLLSAAFMDTLGPNPGEALVHRTGSWTMRFLCITLAITPVRHWTDWSALARFRRMFGLYAFFYGALHFLCYGWFDMGFVLRDIAHDLSVRRFMLLGTIGLLLMAVLAATSFNRAIKALGAARWKALHKATYLASGLGIFHWYRIAKHVSLSHWGVYASIVLLLLCWRLARRARSFAARGAAVAH